MVEPLFFYLWFVLKALTVWFGSSGNFKESESRGKRLSRWGGAEVGSRSGRSWRLLRSCCDSRSVTPGRPFAAGARAVVRRHCAEISTPKTRTINCELNNDHTSLTTLWERFVWRIILFSTIIIPSERMVWITVQYFENYFYKPNRFMKVP